MEATWDTEAVAVAASAAALEAMDPLEASVVASAAPSVLATLVVPMFTADCRMGWGTEVEDTTIMAMASLTYMGSWPP